MVARTPVEQLGPLRQAKRRQILDAARQLFLERGFERTSMEAIRAAAGVSKPTLYTHYVGKEELFAAVLGALVAEQAGGWLPAAAAGEGPWPTSRQALRATLAMVAHDALAVVMQPHYLALVRIIVAETPRFPRLGEAFRAAVPEQGFHAVASILDHAALQGLASVPDAEMAARLFVGSILSFALTDGLIVAGPPRTPPPERIEVLVDLFLHAIA